MSNKITIIEPSNKWKFINFREFWEYKELLLTFVVRDLKLRYKQTMVGVAWAIIQPLTSMVIFSFFFGKLAKMPSDGVPYPIFSYSGLLLWTYFSNSLSSSANSLVGNSGLITKIYFPRIIIPLASTINGVVDYFVSFIILIGLLLFYKISFSISLLLLPLIVGITWVLSSGMGLWLSSINVKYRDVRYVIPFFLQLLLYVTPVIYPASVAGRFKLILDLNPMTGLIGAHRAIILGMPIPWFSLGISCLFAVIFLLTGSIYFKKTEKYFADII